jgi:hypothetical protein
MERTKSYGERSPLAENVYSIYGNRKANMSVQYDKADQQYNQNCINAMLWFFLEVFLIVLFSSLFT